MKDEADTCMTVDLFASEWNELGVVGNFVFLAIRMAGFGEAEEVDIVEIHSFK